MDHGRRLKTSGWPMAGIKVDERVQQLDSFFFFDLQTCKHIDTIANKKDGKMLVFYYKACYN